MDLSDDIVHEAGPSHVIGAQQMQELEEAVQAIPPIDDSGFPDPLQDYCDGPSFNIIQFLAEGDTPTMSPSGAGRGGVNGHNNLNGHHPHHPHQQQQQHHHNNNMGGVPQQHQLINHNNPHLSNNQRTTIPASSRLPDSPPITDVSAAGSSASPSSNSDSPYSPDNYNNFSVLNGNNGLILGVNGLANQQDVAMLDALQIMQPTPGMIAPGSNGRMSQNGQLFMHSPYPNHQISPQGEAMRTVPNQNQYGVNYQNVYQDMVRSTGSESSLAPIENHPARKRQRTDNTLIPQQQHMQRQTPLFAGDIPLIKSEPVSHYPTSASRFAPTPGMHMASSPIGGDSYMDENFYQGGEVIKFTRYAEETWNVLMDEHQNILRQIQVHVVADKGFNYSPTEKCFVNQKKNHFQISVNIEANDNLPPAYVCVNGRLLNIKELQIDLVGVKSEQPTEEILIRQSQTDRKPLPHTPVKLDKIPALQLTKVTVPRLHFALTTLNNQRKNNKPNPDQKYFLLVVRLRAVTEDDQCYLVQAYVSERFIVRATNPGQFETPEVEVSWQKLGGMMYTLGQVGIGTNVSMGGALNVNGDIVHTGSMAAPSDIRLKDNIVDMDPEAAKERLNKLRIVQYRYKEAIANQWGLSEQARNRVGVIAQELAEIIPEAVKTDGEFLTVDEQRIIYDTVMTTQELCKLHDHLEDKMDGNVDSIKKSLAKIFRPKDTAPASPVTQTTGSDASGLAERKSLSASSYSLTSNFMRAIAKQSKAQHKDSCRNPGCGRSDNSHCSSRLTQGTIVSLVFVMAVCLISMSALYVLDWHNRNYGMHAIVPPPTPTVTEEPIGLMKKTMSMPRFQPGAPPIHELCTHGSCRTYCCESMDSYRNEKRHGGFDIDNVVPLAGSREAFLSSIAGAEKMSPTAFFPKPLSSGVRFELVGMNMTIDSRYCAERTCNEKKGRYHLFIPMSPYMPTTPVYLRVTPPEGQFVRSCGHMLDFLQEECPVEGEQWQFSMHMPTAFELESNLFEISAGAYRRSGYRFRIGTNSESCFGSEERFKSSYEEYNLIFYRACHDRSTSTSDPTMIESETERGNSLLRKLNDHTDINHTLI